MRVAPCTSVKPTRHSLCSGILADPILDAAGSDVSHWFDAKTGDVKYHIDPETQLNIPYTPQGRFIHVPPRDPTTAWSIDGDLPWWKDPKLVMGHVTAKVRRIRIVNTLTHQEHVVEVGCEESIEEISSRYLAWNAHAGSYTWKALLDGHFRSMDMACTLEENGVPDDDLEMEGLLLDPDLFLPTLHLYYNDDLTSA